MSSVKWCNRLLALAAAVAVVASQKINVLLLHSKDGMIAEVFNTDASVLEFIGDCTVESVVRGMLLPVEAVNGEEVFAEYAYQKYNICYVSSPQLELFFAMDHPEGRMRQKFQGAEVDYYQPKFPITVDALKEKVQKENTEKTPLDLFLEHIFDTSFQPSSPNEITIVQSGKTQRNHSGAALGRRLLGGASTAGLTRLSGTHEQPWSRRVLTQTSRPPTSRVRTSRVRTSRVRTSDLMRPRPSDLTGSRRTIFRSAHSSIHEDSSSSSDDDFFGDRELFGDEDSHNGSYFHKHTVVLR